MDGGKHNCSKDVKIFHGKDFLQAYFVWHFLELIEIFNSCCLNPRAGSNVLSKECLVQLI